MPYQVLTQSLAFQKVDPDNPMVAVGDEEVVLRGGLVPEYASTFLVNALSNAGVIVPVAEPDPRLFPLAASPVSTRTPDQPVMLQHGPVAPALAVGTDGTFTDGPDLSPTGDGAEPFDSADPFEPDEPFTTDRPGPRDNKSAWEAYAEQVGVDRAQAESMTKADLIAEVERREAESGTTL